MHCLLLFQANVAFGKTSSYSSRNKVAAGSDKAVDGTIKFFNSKSGYFPHWLMIDFGETIPIVKVFFMHAHQPKNLDKMIVTIGRYGMDLVPMQYHFNTE